MPLHLMSRGFYALTYGLNMVVLRAVYRIVFDKPQVTEKYIDLNMTWVYSIIIHL